MKDEKRTKTAVQGLCVCVCLDFYIFT